MIFNYDKKSGQFNSAISGFAKNIKDGIFDAFHKTNVSGFGNELLDSLLKNANPTQTLKEFSQQNAESLSKIQLPTSFVKFFSDADKNITTVGDALQSTETKVFSFGNALSKIGSIGATALSTLGTMALTMAATWAAGEFIKFIYEWINADKIAIEQGKQATQSIQDRYEAYGDLNDKLKEMGKSASGKDTMETTKESIEAIADKYAELHDGVNELTNANETLSTEKYQEYLDISNQIAEQFPSLISEYDEQGNAILNVGNTAATAAANLMKMYEASKLSANVEIGDNLQSSYEGYMAAVRTYGKKNSKLNAEKTQKESDKEVADLGAKIIDGMNQIEVVNYSSEVANKLSEILGQEYGLLPDMAYGAVEGERYIFNIPGLTNKISEMAKTSGQDNATVTNEIQNRISDTIGVIEQQVSDTIDTDLSEIDKEISTNDLYLKDQKKAITGVISNYLDTSDIFTEQSTGFQNALKANLEDLDLSVIENKYDGKILRYLYGELIQPISELTPSMQTEIDKMLETSTKNISANEYRNNINRQFVDLFGVDAGKWSQLLGFQDIFDEIDTARDSVFTELGGVGKVISDQETYEAILGLSLDDLRIYADLVKEGVYETWEELQKAFDDMKKKQDTKPDGVLSDIFNDESYKTSAESNEKSLSSLTSALETLRSEGTLTSEAMRDLQEEFPSLTDFTTEGISKAGTKYLSDWIGQFKSGWTDFSEEGKAQLDTYVANLMASYRNIIANQTDVENEIKSTLRDEIGMGGFVSDNQYSYYIEQLQKSLPEGEELNWNIVLALKDRFSGDIDTLIKKYDEYKLIWNIEIRKDELQHEIDALTSQRDVNSAQQSLNEALGLSMSKEDYQRDDSISQALITRYQEQKKLAIDEINKHYTNEAGEVNLDNFGQMMMDQINDTYDKLIIGEKTNMANNAKAIAELPLTKIEEARTRISRGMQALQDDISLAESSGKGTSKSQYQGLIDYLEQDNSELQEAEKILKNNISTMEERFGSRAKDNLFYDTWQTQLAENLSKQAENNKQIIENQKSITELPYTTAQEELDRISREADHIQSQFDRLESQGKEITEESYNGLISVNDRQLQQAKIVRDEAQRLLQNTDMYYEEDGVKRLNQDWVTYSQNYSSAVEAVEGYKAKQLELNEAVANLPLLKLQNELTDLQGEATKVQDLMSLNEAKGLKASVKQYEKLVKNSKEQIKNLQKQNAELAIQRIGLDKNSSKYRDITSQINSNRSAIMSAQQDLLGYQQTAATLISSNAQNLASALSSAMSEMNSETGITTDTMKSLEQAFSDLYGRDVSNIFYETSDGMKMNVDAAKDLIEAEYELQASNLKAEIEQQNQIIENQKGLYTEDANAAVDAANKRIDAATRELAMLQALYDQQQQTLSGYGQWQIAESTANAGARYTGLQGNVENIKKAYEQGLTGTDEFKAYVEMLDQWGEDTIGAYNRVLPKIDRYLTDNYQGTKNFYDDLVAEGFGTFEDNAYKISIPNVKEAADALGISQEWFDIMMSRGEDYGFSNDWVSSVVDGELKIKDVTQELIDEEKHYQELLRNGATEEVLNESQQKIEAYKESLKNLHENVEDVREREGKITSTELQTAVAQIDTINKELEEGLIDPDVAKDNIQQIAEESNIELTTDINGNLVVDKEAMDEQFPEWDIPVTLKPQWDNVTEADTENNPTYASAVDKIQQGWDESSTELQEYIDTLNGADISQLKELNLDDGKIDVSGLEKEEKALDKIKEKFKLTADEATHLVDILEKTNVLNGDSGEKTYNKTGGVYEEEELPTLGELVVSKAKQGIETAKSFLSNSFQQQLQQKEERETEYQPITSGIETASTELSTNVKSASTDIVAAIESGSDLVANAINGETQEDVIETSKDNSPSFKVSDTKPSNALNNRNMLTTDSGTGNPIDKTVIAKMVPDYSEVENTDIDVEGEVDLEVNEEKVEEEKENIENNPFQQFVELVYSQSNNEQQPQTPKTQTVETTQKTIQENEVHTTNTTEFKGNIDDLEQHASLAKEMAEGVAGDYVANLEGVDNVSGPVNNATSAINRMPTSKTSTVDVVVNGLEAVNSAKDAIAQLKNKRVELTTVHKDVNVVVQQAFGTAHSIGSSYATGTVYDMWTDYRHSIGAYANGTTQDWRLPQDESALVNEFAPQHPESIVRDGRWFIIPGGPHVEQLKKNDIIFNAEQTDDLIRTGRTARAGKLALASGTAYNTINSYATGVAFNGMSAHGGTTPSTDTSNVNPWNKQYATGQKTGTGTGALEEAVKTAGKQVQDAGNNVGDAAQNTESALDKFKKWADSLFDWIEVRMERLQHSIDKSTAESELERTYQKKNSHVEDAMEVLAGDTTKMSRANKTIREEKAAAKKAGVNVKNPKTKFGNIDMNDRQTIKWNNKNLRNNKEALQSLDPEAKKNWSKYKKSIKGTTSTVLGGSSEYKGVKIAYSPILQTENGPELLTQQSLDNYINALIDKNGGKVDSNLIALDKEGITEDGKVIKGLIADVGKTARKTGEQMHYVGQFGSIQMAKNEKNDLSGKIQQDQAGAKRYYNQADQIRARAISDEILPEGQIKELVNLIQNGAIDIAEYKAKEIDDQNKKDGKNSSEENPVTDFISAYSNWYDKAQQMELQYYEDRQKLIEMEQTQLDNITEEFDTRIGEAESNQSRRSAQKEFDITRGIDPRKESIEANIQSQLNDQDEMISLYNAEAEAYKQEMADAKKIFGKDSNEYRQAQAQYNEIVQAGIEAQTKRIQMEKDYEQERLDFIENRYNSRIGYVEAVKGSSESLTSLYRTRGYKENGQAMKSTYQTQMDQQKKVTQLLNKEVNSYSKELERAKEQFGENSDEYRAAQTNLEGMRKQLNESKEAARNLKEAFLDLDVTVSGYVIERLKMAADEFADKFALKERRGQLYNDDSSEITAKDYNKQVKNNIDIIEAYYSNIALLQKELDELDPNVDSGKYIEKKQQIRSAESEIQNLRMSNEDLKDSVRELRWKPFNDLSKQIDENISDFQHLQGLMKEESFFDENGKGWNLTKAGKANIGLIASQMDENIEKIALYRRGLEKLDQDFKNKNINQEKYNETSRQYVEIIQQSASANQTLKDSLVDLYKTQITNENDALQKLIDKRKEALGAKKA